MGERSQAPINLLPQEESGLEQLAGAQPSAHNCVVDARGAVRKRPGIQQFGSIGDPIYDGPITGMHVDVQGRVWAAATNSAGAYVFRVTPDGNSVAAGFMLGPERVQFAETQAMIVAAAGDRLWRSNISVPMMEPLPGNPPQATHIVAQASRLVAMGDVPDANAINYSAPAAGTITTGHEQWNGDSGSDSGVFPINARPDFNQAMHDNTNECFVWGQSTLQVIAPDAGISRFAPVSTRELGLLAPYSVIKDDQSFAWLDHYRRIVVSDGRTFTVISDPIKQTLEELEDPTSLFGYRCLAGPTDALVWTFPTPRRTFVYTKTGRWSEWSSWSQATQNWTKFPVTAAAQDQAAGRTVVGLEDGRLGILTHEVHDDLGVPFAAWVQTGFEDRNTTNRKHCVSVALTLRRGFNRPSAQVPAMLLEWRDDEGAWSSPLEVSLGTLPDREVVVRFYGLGMYRRRQWRFTFLSSDALALVGVQETFEVMGV